MPILPLLTQGEQRSVVTDPDHFDRSGSAILITNVDTDQFSSDSIDCNVSYDLRVGSQYKDHRDMNAKHLDVPVRLNFYQATR
jgi:dCTP deaminase